MRRLVRLVTPPGGTVLEPFAGSGTTLEACLLEGFDSIGIERDEQFVPLICRRVSRVVDPVATVVADGDSDGGLFDLL
jgi:DNA modification methylase